MNQEKHVIKICLIRPAHDTKELAITHKQLALAGVSLIGTAAVGAYASFLFKDFLLFHQPAIQGFVYLG